MSESFVVKVQLSLASSGPESVMVYNEDKSVFYTEEEPAQVASVKEALNGHPKAFFYASLTPDDQLELTGVAPWQEW